MFVDSNQINASLINESESYKKWAPIIESTTGIKDKNKLKWISKYCQVHQIYENNKFAVPSAINGMGQTLPPGAPTSLSGFGSQPAGSGDKMPTLLPLAMQVAAQTIGFDLVPIVQMTSPMGMLTYMDYVYAGGRLDGIGLKDNPLLIKIDTKDAALEKLTEYYLVNQAAGKAIHVKYLGVSRLGYSIFQVISSGTYDSGTNTYSAVDGVSIIDVVNASGWDIVQTDGTAVKGGLVTNASLVKALEDHIAGFSGGNFDELEPYSRGEGELQQDNLLNIKMFSKSVEAKTVKVAVAVTREQMQDLSSQFNYTLSQIESVLLNELTQTINKMILDRLFKLGIKNHANIAKSTGVVFHLNLSDTDTPIDEFGPFIDSDGVNRKGDFPVQIAPTEGASSNEDLHKRQRKIYSRILAASNMINIRGRRGPANFVVCNGQIATALQDSSAFILASIANNISQMNGSLYVVGSIGGLTVYVDPNMSWDDTRVLVGRKCDDANVGLVFMPYILADRVETIAEGTMAPKISLMSRFALVDAGHHPETQYITFGVYSKYSIF